MNNQDDRSIADLDPALADETGCRNLDLYIDQLKDCATKIRNRETPPPKGQISGILIAVVLIFIFEVFIIDSEDTFFVCMFMATILVRLCNTGRDTIAGIYEEAATALETFQNTGMIPEIDSREECLKYINTVVESCQKGLGDNTVRTPKQWLKGIR